MAEIYNRDLKLLLDLMDDLKTEITNSQSMRLHVGLVDKDQRRFAETLELFRDKVNAMATGDFPETHPTVLSE